MTTTTSTDSTIGDIIHGYSRAEALRDGVLHDVTDLAHEAGIRWPVAIASHAWADAVAWPGEHRGETEHARAWDVVWTASNAIRTAPRPGGDRIDFTVSRTTLNDPEPRPIHLAVHAGPGDQCEPVLTITSAADE